MSALENMTKGYRSAAIRAAFFEKMADRVRSKKTTEDADIFPMVDPVDLQPWKESTLQRHRKGLVLAYSTLSQYWDGVACSLKDAIKKEEEKISSSNEEE